jgi:DNA segregation ATPase FtsK/SpoIIIE, S-DNA-T family
MAGARREFNRAVSAHREAATQLRAAQQDIDRLAGDASASNTSAVQQARLAAELDAAARQATPGWLGTDWDATVLELPYGRDVPPRGPLLLRIGTARPVPEAGFRAIVPLLAAGHLTVAQDTRQPAVRNLVRGLLVRMLAACKPGTFTLRGVDAGTVGATLAPFQPLAAAGAMPPVATDHDGFLRILDEAEDHVRRFQEARSTTGAAPEMPYLVLAVASPPAEVTAPEWSRLAALAHAGPRNRLHLIVAGYPPPAPHGDPLPPLEDAVAVSLGEDGTATLTDPPGFRPYSAGGLDAPVELDAGPPDRVIAAVCRTVGAEQARIAKVMFKDLLPGSRWPDSSIDGLRTLVGRDGAAPVELGFTDATPHWLVGGRTGSGKTVFLLDVLYGLAARYSPDELALYLLDFKEGVSFTEFTPTPADESWIPHARAVGIESDREYGVAVLAELVAEISRRSTAMKRAGVTNLTDLRAASDVALPRILTVIDEFHVLFAGDDRLARRAATLLEELARKGRSYGIHLILASQTTSGVDTLIGKSSAIFGQFGLRIALAGATGVLDALNQAADGLTIGTAVVNDAGGIAGHNRLVAFPDAHAEKQMLAWLRRELWKHRVPGLHPPAIFAGYAAQHVTDDATYQTLAPGARRRYALVGRRIDVPGSTASFALDATPGRHLAVLGTSPVGADILHAAVLGLTRQHTPGTARFVIAPLVAAADTPADQAAAAARAAGHHVDIIDPTNLVPTLAAAATAPTTTEATYLVLFGADAASVLLTGADDETFTKGHDHLAQILRAGPAHGVHVLGWWRTLNRFRDDLTAGNANREDVACMVALNVPANDLMGLLNQYDLDYRPRDNRALLIDHHDNHTELIVPFTRPDSDQL